MPSLLAVTHIRNDPPSLFAWDTFHTWHLGLGKTFLGTALVLLATSAIFDFAGGVDKRLDAVTERFLEWCDEQGVKPHLRTLSKHRLSWAISTMYPSGVWSKGHTTRVLNKYFLAECRANSQAVLANDLLTIAFRCAVGIENFLKGLYVFIPQAKAVEISDHGLSFLRWYGRGAQKAFDQSKRLFFLQPNLHRLHHIVYDMSDAAKHASSVLNPLALSTQPEEDYIGRPSRLSRRVSSRLAIQRTFQRSLVAAYAAYRDAGLIVG